MSKAPATEPAYLRADAPELVALVEALRTLSKYAKWQMKQGGAYHPTLPSAEAAARAALAAFEPLIQAPTVTADPAPRVVTGMSEAEVTVALDQITEGRGR